LLRRFFTNAGKYLGNYKIKLFNVTAAYAQYELKPAEALRVVMSLRYDHYCIGFDDRLPVHPEYQSIESSRNQQLQHCSAKLGLTYDLGNKRSR